MSKQNPIDELFKSNFEGHELKPSTQAWEKISGALEGKKKGGFYFMRAAAVTLLVGLSTFFYFNNNKADLMPSPIDVNNKIDTNEVVSNNLQERGKEKNTSDEEEKKDEGKSKREIVPVIRNTQPNKQLLVEAQNPDENAASMDEVNAETIVADASQALEPIKNRKKPKVKLKYTVPVTQKSFYAEKPLEKKETLPGEFKEKVLAYANNQVGNILSGEPVSLPKTKKGKPQIEINLGGLFKK